MAGEAITRLSPTVFQCSSCRSLLTDHTLLKVGYEHLELLAFKGLSNVKLDPCRQSGSLLTASDWMFVTLPESCEPLYNTFCLEISKLQSYEIGQSEVSISEGGQDARQDALMNIAGPQAEQSGTHNGMSARVHALEGELTKVQNMLLLHQEHIMRLGEHCGLPNEPHLHQA